jgi:hypothetical protein
MSDKRSDKFANDPVANIGVRSNGSSDLISLVDAAVKTAKGRTTARIPTAYLVFLGERTSLVNPEFGSRQCAHNELDRDMRD